MKIFLWLQAKASGEEKKCLRVGTCPHSITASPAVLFSVLLRQWKDIHTFPWKVSLCIVSLQSGGFWGMSKEKWIIEQGKWIIGRPREEMGNEADLVPAIRGKKWQGPLGQAEHSWDAVGYKWEPVERGSGDSGGRWEQPLAVSGAKEPSATRKHKGRAQKVRRKQRAGKLSCVLCSAAAPACGGVQG